MPAESAEPQPTTSLEPAVEKPGPTTLEPDMEESIPTARSDLDSRVSWSRRTVRIENI